MAGTRRFRNSRGGSPLRPVDWIGAQVNADLFILPPAIGTVCEWVVTPSEIAEQFTNPTLMATRMKVAYDALVTLGAGTFQFVAVGLIEWMAAADTLPTPCPDPLLDTDFDWIIRQVFPVGAIAGTSVEISGNTDFGEDYMSAAKRRLETGSGLLLAISVESLTANVQVDVRCLIKE